MYLIRSDSGNKRKEMTKVTKLKVKEITLESFGIIRKYRLVDVNKIVTALTTIPTTTIITITTTVIIAIILCVNVNVETQITTIETILFYVMESNYNNNKTDKDYFIFGKLLEIFNFQFLIFKS